MGDTLSEVWPVVHAERAQLVEDLSRIPDDSWTTPSLCPGWTVHDVLAHLVDTALTSRLGFARRMILARLNFDKANTNGILAEKRTTPHDTLEAMRAVVELRRTPPANAATRLVEAFVHGEDIRRPLQLSSNYPVESVVEALTYQCKTAVNFGGGRERVVGLRLIATDVGFTYGPADGQQVCGQAIDLLLAVSGRPVPTSGLTGPGAPALRDLSA